MQPIITKTPTCVWWTGGFEVDADGSPGAYGPDGGEDFLANAGGPGNWYGILTDDGKRTGNPVVQGPGDPRPGKYIAVTSLQDHSKALHDPRRYVDSSTVDYVSIPSELLTYHGGPISLGDLARVTYHGKVVAAIVADVGPRGKYGEGSERLCVDLGLDPSPKHGGTGSGVMIELFPHTSKGWPRTQEDIEAQLENLT